MLRDRVKRKQRTRNLAWWWSRGQDQQQDGESADCGGNSEFNKPAVSIRNTNSDMFKSPYPSLHTFIASHQTCINQCHYIPLFNIKDTNVFIENE